ncbi:nucleotidyltransferase family protein [Methylobacterium sp. JK268]
MLEQLRDYAHARAGRFVIFGSFVERRMRHDSDLDILIDFPVAGIPAAWDFVEEACSRADLPPDIHDASTSTPSFVERILAKGLIVE